jgi:subtilisin-like proprotein convertase family protein
MITLLVCSCAPEAVASFVFNPNLTIPDNSILGVAGTQTISMPAGIITGVKLSLNIVGTPGASNAFNGDLYAYLQHAGGSTMLLNRTGRTASNAFGYGDSGFDVTFEDAAINGDIHAYRDLVNPAGGALTGTWQPDGRLTNPNSVLLTDSRPALLGSFNGLDLNGAWTLFVADVSPIGTGILKNWTLDLTVTPIPEPTTVGFGVVLLGFCAGTAGRTRLRSRPQGNHRRHQSDLETGQHPELHPVRSAAGGLG